MSPAVDRLANYHIAALALWQLGGATERKATEDVAIEAWRLSRQRFSWQRHPEYPNLDTARVALSDAKKAKYGSLVVGDHRTGWLLTQNGVKYAQSYDNLNGRGMRPETTLRIQAASALQNIKSHAAFTAWHAGNRHFDVYEAADSLALPADAPKSGILHRVNELANAASLANDGDAEAYLRWLKDNITQGG